MAEFNNTSDIWLAAYNAALASGTLAAIADDCADRAVAAHHKRFRWQGKPTYEGYAVKEDGPLGKKKDDTAG